jgi:nicotinamidase-related amidase
MAGPNLLDPRQAALVVIDVQERLMPHIDRGEEIIEQCRRLVVGAKLLGVPVIATAQYVKGLGPIVPELQAVLEGAPIIEKREFSAFGRQEFLNAVAGHSQLLLCGVETHVCVNQTANDALAAGHAVHVAADAVGSRTEENRRIGLEKMRTAGAVLTSTEAALFELLRTSEHPQFKAISALVK